ncbi:hypothetical protein MBLNU459_g7155t1 [Dothideomycetes sp. NU459]
MDATNSTPTSATSPKVTKKHSLADIRFPGSPGGQAIHGCDHVKTFLESNHQEAVKQYTTIIHALRKTTSITAHLTKSSSSSAINIRPTYLCIQCANVATPDQRDKHDKAHVLCAESGNGLVYCRECEDFVYDPTLEEVRNQQGKKRKYTAYMSDVDSKILAANALSTPCRARGLRGLYNMGQTCFMSVVIQSLIHNPFIRSYYLSVGHRSMDCERESCTSCALDDIFTEFHSTEKAEGYGAVAMLQGSWKGEGSLAGYQQQDAHEYLQFILNSLHSANLDDDEKEEKAEDCACIIHRTFCGLLRSTVQCSKCKNVTAATDPFMDLSLDLRSPGGAPKKKKALNGAAEPRPPPIDLAECFDRFTSAELLPAADYRCRTCDGPQNATKRMSLSRLPPVLPVHLKRFSHSKSLSSSIKLDTKVNFPVCLDVGPYMSRAKPKKSSGAETNGDKKDAAAAAAAAAAAKDKDGEAAVVAPPARPVYELSSVIVHKGKMDSGHYVSYSREGDEWFLFDDSKVVLVEEKEVLAAEAYMLFYVIREID